MNDTVKSKMETVNGKREPLAQRLPLEVPLSISVTTANVCNLECEFCAISEKGRERNKNFMELETYELFMKRLTEAKWNLKQIVLVGLGEPLLNKNIVNFVRLTKQTKAADKVHIVTNGVLLTNELSDMLIEAELDVLRISLNGLSDEDYQKYTNRKIDFNKMYESIKYYCTNRKSEMKVYVKIMDYMLDTEAKKEKFYSLFKDMVDVVNVEYITEMSTTLDYSAVADDVKVKGLKGFEITETKICPLPFYHIYLNAEGTISACCVAGPWYTPPALVMGDLYQERIDDIWKGADFYKLHTTMLKCGKDHASEVCKNCKAYLSYIYPEDVITAKEAAKIERRLNSK